jgi:hypothetical protein
MTGLEFERLQLLSHTQRLVHKILVRNFKGIERLITSDSGDDGGRSHNAIWPLQHEEILLIPGHIDVGIKAAI